MTEQELREILRRVRAGSIDAEQDIWDWWKQVTSLPSKPLRCLRCGTVDAFGEARDLPDVPQTVEVTPAMIETAARAVGYRDYIRGMHSAPEKAEAWSRQHYDMYMGIAETALRAVLGSTSTLSRPESK